MEWFYSFNPEPTWGPSTGAQKGPQFYYSAHLFLLIRTKLFKHMRCNATFVLPACCVPVLSSNLLIMAVLNICIGFILF